MKWGMTIILCKDRVHANLLHTHACSSATYTHISTYLPNYLCIFGCLLIKINISCTFTLEYMYLRGVHCCNPSKWEAEFWGWLEVWRPALLCFTVNQRPHWACWQYGHSGGTQGWLGVGERAIWAVGYIQQLKALLASSSGICWWVSTV